MDILSLQSFRTEERAVFQMRKLFEQYSFQRFKMSRFEPYDLYIRNRDFLVSDRMITFTDTDGTLLALKPDVTISIIKNSSFQKGFVRKVYYQENVFRPGKNDAPFRELMQTGLECIGDVELYTICEVISLAAKSLQLVSPDYILDISHLGLISGVMEDLGIAQENYAQILQRIREKNISELSLLAKNLGYSQETHDMLCALVLTYGEMEKVLKRLAPLCRSEKTQLALSELRTVYDALCAQGLEKNVRIDFSLVNDLNYYNGLVFQGFIKGIVTPVLSGGQYDRLMSKMGKEGRAVGFAVYLDALDALSPAPKETDVDVLILYDDETAPDRLFSEVKKCTAYGAKVLTARKIPENLKAGKCIDLTKKGGASWNI